MSTASVWFVTIDKNGKKGRPTTVAPTSSSPGPPRVTTIHVVNWHGKDHQVEVVIDPGHTSDILIDVPKM